LIEFKTVRYKNFLSTGQQFIEVPLNKGGTTLVIGDNGSGKSTMLDALCFGLFNRPFRDIKKDQIVNSINEKDCIVEIEFNIGSNQYKIVRGIKPNKFEIWCNDKMLNQDAAAKDYQKHLEDNIIRLNFRSFTQVVILGSSSFVPFMRLQPRWRRMVVEEILDIEIFTRMNFLLREKNKNKDEEIRSADFSVNLFEEKIADQDKHIQDLQYKNKQSIEGKQSTIEKEEAGRQQYVEDIKDLDREISQLRDKILDETEVKSKHMKFHQLEAKLESNCNKHKTMLKFFEENDDCPTCKQTINDIFKTEQIENRKEKLGEIEKGMSEMSSSIQKIESRMTTIQNTVIAIREKEMLIERFKTSIESIDRYIKTISGDIDSLRDEKESTGEAKGVLKQLRESFSEAEKNKLKLKEEKLYLETARELMTDTGIKTKIIKQYLPIMNQLINKNLQNLDFYVNFTLDAEFNETIKSRYRDNFNYNNFSEGEKLRIDLSVLFTWREIAKIKNSTNTNLLILDEVLDSSLDSSGTEEFMKIINSLSNENVFVISHKGDILVDKFTQVIKYEKYKNFTRVA
jgi:DNA repair exonuclease SbcCD ATPase subunit|tara:strand:+ start:3465 stop:5174 length:1710 start_codon:yes stop_codon:yes gene_type:complete